jgi:hypothetical protein
LLLTIVFKPNDTRIIIQLLSKVIDPGNELSENFDLSHAAIAVLEHAETIMPWLWRASKHGIQTEFIMVMVLPTKILLIQTSFWLSSRYRPLDDLECENDPADEEIVKVMEGNLECIDLLEVHSFTVVDIAYVCDCFSDEMDASFYENFNNLTASSGSDGAWIKGRPVGAVSDNSHSLVRALMAGPERKHRGL